MERCKFMPDGPASDPQDPPELPAWLGHTMQRPRQGRSEMLAHIAQHEAAPRVAQTGPSANAAAPSGPGFGEFAGRLIATLVFSGLIGSLVSSRFPTDLGLFLFFTNDDFIEWVFRKFGVRFAPDGLGPELIKCLAFMTAWTVLLARWTDAAPAWLSSWLGPAQPWSPVAGAALFGLAGVLLAALVGRRLRPRLGIEIAQHGLASALLVGVILLGMLAFLAAAGLL